MRIISGKYKGRNIVGFNLEGTRPTQSRVKESIFSMIQGKIPDVLVLDLFAGSGNLGIEALSNGAKYAYFVDINKDAYKIIRRNLQDLGIQNAKVLQADYRKALTLLKGEGLKFHLVFLDPPYKDLVLDEILEYLTEHNLLEEESLVICEYENDHMKEAYGRLVSIKEKKYGYKTVRIYENQKN